MMSMSLRGMASVLAISAFTAGIGAVAPAPASAAAAPPRYRYIDLGFIGTPASRPAFSSAASLNNSGTVVGESTIDGPYALRAFSWNNGVMRNLGALAEGNFTLSVATAVNERGVVVGYSHPNGTEPPHAFRTSGAGLVDLGTGYGPGSGSAARDVNDRGVVVGTRFEKQGTPERAVVWRDGKIIDLGTLGGQAGRYGTDGIAHAVNNRGHVVGGAAVPEGGLHAFLWTGGALKDIGTLGGTTESTYATGINDRGEIVGASQNTAAEVHATLWRNGNIRDLGTLGGGYSEAHAINEAGQVVGVSTVPAGGEYDGRAFLWQRGTMRDLNTLVPELPDGVTLYSASDINDRGAISGFACPYDCDAGGFLDRHAFLLVPIS
jgi:probable HAF family extracellular repeat protein